MSSVISDDVRKQGSSRSSSPLIKLVKLIIVEFFADNGVQAITLWIIISIEILGNIDD